MSLPHKPVPAWAWLGYAASAAGLLVLLVLPGHKYDWMAAVDPATDPAALADPSGNRFLFATVVMVAAVVVQALWFFKAGLAHGPRHRMLPCLLAAAVVALWALKFWR